MGQSSTGSIYKACSVLLNLTIKNGHSLRGRKSIERGSRKRGSARVYVNVSSDVASSMRVAAFKPPGTKCPMDSMGSGSETIRNGTTEPSLSAKESSN